MENISTNGTFCTQRHVKQELNCEQNAREEAMEYCRQALKKRVGRNYTRSRQTSWTFQQTRKVHEVAWEVKADQKDVMNIEK